jgi:branched-chain amino acid transport system ATP-binding protein
VPLLAVENVSRHFGGIVALQDVSLSIDEGEIVGLIGPNGAGKTTAFNVITRLYSPASGSVVFDGQDLLRVPASKVVRLGIARTFQNLALFSAMTVLENVLVGAHARLGGRGSERALRAEALELLAYLGLDAHARRPAAGLPFGTLKRLELARALIAKPRLLLLDEPAGGLNHEEVSELSARIRQLKADFGLTILLVEHHMNLVMSISDRVTVLNFGRVIASGTPAEVQASQQVVEAYLGIEEDAEAIADVASGEDD